MNMKIKIAAVILAAGLLASGCGKFVRDELITMQNEIDLLYGKVDEMNKGLETLKSIVTAMGDNGYIVGVEEGVDDAGRQYYKLKFRTVKPDADWRGFEVTDDAYSILLYTGVDGRDGVDALPYVVSVKQDEEDGRWYWYSTQDADWLRSESGDRFLVDGKTPQLKVEEGFWFLSWDGGNTWEDTGWKAKGEDAYEVFTKAEVFDDRVELTLASDGSVLVLPRFLPVDVTLTIEGQNPEEAVLIAPGETISIHYVLSGTGAESALLVAGTDGRLKTALRAESATEGTVDVTCPEVFPEGGYVYITVNDGNGRSDVRVIRFDSRKLKLLYSEPEHVIPVADKEAEFAAPAAGRDSVILTFQANFELDAACAFPEGVDPWMTVKMETVEGVPMLMYDVAANTAAEARTGVIVVGPKDHPDFEVFRVTVKQAAAETGSGQSGQ